MNAQWGPLFPRLDGRQLCICLCEGLGSQDVNVLPGGGLIVQLAHRGNWQWACPVGMLRGHVCPPALAAEACPTPAARGNNLWMLAMRTKYIHWHDDNSFTLRTRPASPCSPRPGSPRRRARRRIHLAKSSLAWTRQMGEGCRWAGFYLEAQQYS